jgi:hypothetical protein
LEADEGKVIFKNITLYSQKISAANRVFVLRPSSSMELIDAVAGNAGHDTSGHLIVLTDPGATLSASRTQFIQGCTDQYVIENDNSILTLKSCLIQNGSYAIRHVRPLAESTIYNCTFYGYSSRGLGIVLATDVTKLDIKNNVFGESALPGIVDNSSLTETDSETDYNCYYGAPTNLANNGGSHRIDGDPKLQNPSNGDYRLKKGSPCPFAGTEIPGNDICGRKMPQKHGQCMGAIQPRKSVVPIEDFFIKTFNAGCKP